jgi:hypothetical protein
MPDEAFLNALTAIQIPPGMNNGQKLKDELIRREKTSSDTRQGDAQVLLRSSSLRTWRSCTCWQLGKETMAKILNTFAAVERYALRRDGHDHRLDPAVPDQIDIIHAGVFPEDEQFWSKQHHVIADATEPVFATYSWTAEQSACGRTIKVFLPKPFDSEDPKACEKCVLAVFTDVA